MYSFLKKQHVIPGVLSLCAFLLFVLNGCMVNEKISMKSGAQLWSENCQRCHNTPSPSTFSPEQWETVGLHMQSRALLTDTEREKIVAFLKQ